jgi:predicted RNase H-like HicB family nuclease
MQKKHAARGYGSPMDFGITITPEVHKDGKWYVAFCPEVPEANGQGRTREESVESLKEGVISIMQDRRRDARIRGLKSLCFTPITGNFTGKPTARLKGILTKKAVPQPA